MGPPAPDPPATYRVEHAEEGEVSVLGTLTNVTPHHTALDVFLTPLLRRGATGELRLIDEATDRVIARRTVRQYPESSRGLSLSRET